MRSTRRRVQKKQGSSDFDKYDLYRRSVQSPEGDVIFFRKLYRELRGQNPKDLREDFCGTGLVAMEWARLRPFHRGYGVDIDPEPMHYGREKYLSRLPIHVRSRVRLLEKNVLEEGLPQADIVLAINFSYFIFKEREKLYRYFKNCLQSLRKKGILIIDVFGGSQCQDAITDVHRLRGFTYYWEQEGFDPVHNTAKFHIHFRIRGKKFERVFSYDWRMWSIPELRELLTEVGFRRTHVYWEGTGKDGSGNGVFTKTEQGEPCLSWIAYIVGEK
ncbi:MAG: class I SAM-dependent methyltransferase [Bdellovibrionaceae bacterium]|nr:class I SAM-dependent methyltransferase [Pseudobdellovibrionaceae bacterium]